MHNTEFVLFFYSRSVSEGLSLVHWSPCLFMFRYHIVVFIYFSRCFLMRFYVGPVQVFRKPCLISLRGFSVVEINSVAWRWCVGYGLVIWDRMLFVTISYCCVSKGIYHIPVLLFLVPFIICCQKSTDISYLSSVMVHSSSYNNPNYISGYDFIFGKYGSA